ncbi:gluconokinase [Alloacidobacterium dinghuense]|uniref:Gluconokinase n=1 Tax=Alloacidobacterium dinghuense TaxID=2763107 RepID=A0A7G8BM19_9BACT|nr:gluconokinase [Alloacidobacterium dinghuense]QNI33589.1 gluconokinase [Alloacidobacterium dinghuense]
MILIVMGVSGSGKTTLAQMLVKLTGWQFAEGDDYHSEANRQKMHSGIPLTDEDRAPWLATLHELISKWHLRGEDGILTCSALKQTYRETLTADLPIEAYRFILTEAPKEVISQRMHARHHFMPAELLDSQIATLELPANALRVSALEPPEVAGRKVLETLGIATSTTTN